jgi:hypothetical protein
MEEKQTEANVKNVALRNGLIWGVINIVIFLTIYYVVPDMMSSYALAGIQLLIGIGLAVFFTLELRKAAGGYWTFKSALLNIFIMFLISMAISYVFTVVFGKFIDPSYPGKMKELVMAKTESTLKSVGMQESQIEEAMEKTKENLQKQFNPTFSQMISGFGVSAIFYFVGALIFALIFKKERPILLPGTED